jgi:hypothetical protein
MNLYITSISFEDRCLALVRDLPKAESSDLAIVLDFVGYDNVGPYIFNRSKLLAGLHQKNYTVARVQAPIGAPLEALRRIERLMADTRGKQALLDLSTLPRKFIFGLCRMLASSGLPTSIRYYRPAEYGDELSRGVRSVEAVPGFEGDMNPMGETVLALILGFEGYKALHAWERIGPSKVIAFLGDPPFKEEFLQRSKDCNRELLENIGTVRQFPLHTFDPGIARRQLQSAYDEVQGQLGRTSFVLCPLGTKLQSLAAFAFAYTNEKVSVAHVSSLNYFTEAYSRGDSGYVDVDMGGLLEEKPQS